MQPRTPIPISTVSTCGDVTAYTQRPSGMPVMAITAITVIFHSAW
ncbi:hypothetical protein [Nonomuraea gerenzanensis]|nr:hypothetical protein [Nonomuraea gerenzanensis]